MNKQSLLEVDFDHLAWEPVDPQITANLGGTLTPIKMARGKHEVYLNVKFDTSTPAKEKEFEEFTKAFEEIDTKRKDKISDKFLGAVGTNDNEEVKSEDNVDYGELIDGIENDDRLDDSPEDVQEEEVVIDEPVEEEPVEEYDPKKTYKNYIINVEERSIDSGWDDIEAAKLRLNEIEEEGAENYSIYPHGTKLFKIVGDPTTKKWETFGLSNFYIINKTKGEVDSSFDNRAESNKRLKEVEALIERHNKLHAPTNVDSVETEDEADLAINDTYSIVKGTNAIEEYGFQVTHKEIFTPVEEYISAVEKEVKKRMQDLMLESVLTELADPKALDSFYLTFGFNRDFNPSDNSGRIGHSDEYSELEIYLKDFISKDGSVEISSKEFRKACDKAKAKRAYQSTIKTLNHTAEYFHQNLGFGAKEDLSKIGRGKQSDYDTREGEIDTNPAGKINADYVTAQGGSRESNQYDVGFDDNGKGKFIDDADGKEARQKYSEDIGINAVRKAKEKIYTVINDPKYVNQFKDYIDYADDVESYIDANYHPDKAHLSAQFRGEIEEFLKAADDLRDAHDKIMKEVTPKNDAEKERLKKKGHIGNTPVIRSSMNSGSEVGVALHTDNDAIDAKNKYKEIYLKYSKLDSTTRRKKAEEEYRKTYGESLTDTLSRINKDREAHARVVGGYGKMRASTRQDNKEITKPSRKKQ